MRAVAPGLLGEAVAAFRADVARAGAYDNADALALVDELCRQSPEFAAMWRDHDVQGHGEGTKQLRHPAVGMLALEYSSFAVDGRPDLSMMVYNPATEADREKLRALINPPSAGHRSRGRSGR